MGARTNLYFLSLAAAGLGVILSGGLAAQASDEETGPTCIAEPNIRRTQLIDEDNIVFLMRDKTIQHNTLARRCPGLRKNSQISLTRADRLVCSGHNFQVLLRVSTGSNSTSVTVPGSNERLSVPQPNMIPGPVCTLGAFESIDEERLDDLVSAAEARRKNSSRSERRRQEAEQQAAEPGTTPASPTSPQ